MSRPTVALVSMPFHGCLSPPLALGLLKAILERAGIASRIYNFNLDFLGHALPDPYILAPEYFDELLPRLAERRLHLTAREARLVLALPVNRTGYLQRPACQRRIALRRLRSLLA